MAGASIEYRVGVGSASFAGKGLRRSTGHPKAAPMSSCWAEIKGRCKAETDWFHYSGAEQTTFNMCGFPQKKKLFTN